MADGAELGPTTVELLDGSAIVITNKDWELLAQATASEGECHRRIEVRQDVQKRVIVLMVIGHDSDSAMGEIVNPATTTLLAALRRWATLFGMPHSCVTECLKQLYG